MLIDDSETVYDQDIATKQARTVQLQTGSNGITYYLEPHVGSLRRIVCRRADGTRVRAPDALDGTFTDVVNATKAVESFLTHKGKAKPVAPDIPVREFSTGIPLLTQVVAPKEQEAPHAEEDTGFAGEPETEEEFQPVAEDSPPVLVGDGTTLNLSKWAVDPEGETVTQRARRERLEAEAATAEPAATPPKTARAPRAARAKK